MNNFLRNNRFRTWLLAILMGLSSVSLFADNTFNQTRQDFRDESIYFMITTRFYDGDPTNNVLCWDNQECQISTGDPCWRGDFAGVIEKLDYIKALGFTAIWITPIVQNASGYDYHGYHAMDFSKVDLRYESKVGKGKYGGYQGAKDVTFQSLIDAAHAKGIKIILDIVLNHTGNFGESYLCKQFNRSQNILNQADIDACMIPITKSQGGLLDDDYLDNVDLQYKKRLKLMKNTDGENHDTKNYWHHVASSWNWDLPNRWWGQIAGDCVDLNTENPAVDDYLIQCYGEFIKMGVDGFRIDTTGHISRLSFNSKFIPAFQELGEQYKAKRQLAGCGEPEPFYMFGECCARFGGVTYRDQPNLSCYYYTWQSSASDIASWRSVTAQDWANVEVKEGADPLLNMLTCEAEASDQPESDNTFMKNGAYHKPDYSRSSGFNVIDFPLHYNFTSASSAYGLAAGGDKYYNDATYNVVYVDSHDYGPQPSDGVRFSGSDAQWAENLSLMFTFRGIPCLYYGSEIGFKRGAKIDNGPNGPLSDTGRAYFGGYIKGDITATDFAEFSATGNANITLNQPLAQHLRVLNKVRQAVPALRRGQWTSDGCSGSGISYKRDCGDDHMACVVLGGSATFSGLPSGTWTNVLTGDTKSGSSFTATANGQGNVAVYVLNYTGKSGNALTGGKDPFIYGTSASAASWDGTQEEGTDKYITANDVVGEAGVYFDKTTTTFTSESLTITAYLTECSSGWISINGGAHQAVSATGTSFTIGAGDEPGTSYEITWGGTSLEGVAVSGKKTFRKIGTYTPTLDSEDEISLFYEAEQNVSSVSIWVWNDKENFTGGKWDSKPAMEYMGVSADGKNIFKWTYTGTSAAAPTKVIFLPNGTQSADLTYKNHGYYVNGTWTKEITETGGDGPRPSPAPEVTFSPASGTVFTTATQDVTMTFANTTEVTYSLNNGTPTTVALNNSNSINLKLDASTTIKVTATGFGGTKEATATYTKEITPVTRPTINISEKDGTTFSTPMTIVITATNADEAKYSINGGAAVSFSDNATITIDQTSTIKVTAKNEAGEVTTSATYTKITPTAHTIYYKNTGNWQNVYLHAWKADNTRIFNEAWPGKLITTQTADGYYYYSFDEGNVPTGIIWNDGNNNKAGGGDLVYKDNEVYNVSGDAGYTYGNQPTPGEGIKVYFQNTANWQKVYAYIWGDTGNAGQWPGNEVTTKTDDGKYYVVTITNLSYSKIIFNNGNGTQTADLAIAENHIYTKDGDTGKTIGDDPTPDPTPTGNAVYFDNSSNWSNVYAYTWKKNSNGSTPWPGVKVSTKTADGKYYKVEITDADADMIIFNNGSGTQTSDLPLVIGHIYNASGDTGNSYTEAKPVITMTDNAEPFEKSMTVVISASGAETSTYCIDGGNDVAFQNSASVTINKTCTITVKATNGGGTSTMEKTYTLKVKERAAGDVDGDGLIDVADFSALVNMIIGKSLPAAGTAEFKGADVDGNGTINTADLTALKAIIKASLK